MLGVHACTDREKNGLTNWIKPHYEWPSFKNRESCDKTNTQILYRMATLHSSSNFL